MCYSVLLLVVTSSRGLSTAPLSPPTPLTPNNPLGPGQIHPWPVTAASAVGLSASKLQAAGDAIGQQGSPLCIAIVKDGALVLDRTYGLGSIPVPPSGELTILYKRPIFCCY
jgi:hypothetical protein